MLGAPWVGTRAASASVRRVEGQVSPSHLQCSICVQMPSMKTVDRKHSVLAYIWTEGVFLLLNEMLNLEVGPLLGRCYRKVTFKCLLEIS